MFAVTESLLGDNDFQSMVSGHVNTYLTKKCRTKVKHVCFSPFYGHGQNIRKQKNETEIAFICTYFMYICTSTWNKRDDDDYSRNLIVFYIIIGINQLWYASPV